MADTAAAPSSPKKVKKTAAPKKPAAHPPVASMVDAAIKALKERKGSSLAAIKKYIAANYKVDVGKLAPFIRRYLKSAVTNGKIIQVKGTGASGSFKLGKEEKPKKVVKPKVKKSPKKVKKVSSKTKKSPKKVTKAKKEKKEKTPKKAKKVKTPKKAAAPKPKAAAKKPAAKKTPKKAAKKPAAKKAAKK